MILLDLVSKGLLNHSKIHTLSRCVLIHWVLKSFLLPRILVGTWCHWCTTICQNDKPTAGQLKEKPDKKGLIGAGMWISIGKYSQNIEIKRVTTWNNNKVTKNHEYCSTNKAKGRAFNKWCDHALPQWTRTNSNVIHSLEKFSWDTSLEKCLWCSSAPLPLPMLSISIHVSKPSLKPTLKGAGKVEISQQMCLGV